MYTEKEFLSECLIIIAEEVKKWNNKKPQYIFGSTPNNSEVKFFLNDFMRTENDLISEYQVIYCGYDYVFKFDYDYESQNIMYDIYKYEEFNTYTRDRIKTIKENIELKKKQDKKPEEPKKNESVSNTAKTQSSKLKTNTEDKLDDLRMMVDSLIRMNNCKDDEFYDIFNDFSKFINAYGRIKDGNSKI